MYPRQQSAQNQQARIAATRPFELAQELVRPPEIQRRGFALGPHWWRMPKQLRRQRDERGAEMVEFAFVVVLLIALLYGIISYGLILAAQATITQAAADGARAGIVASSPGGSTGPPCTTSACTVSEAQAGTDVGWMSKGTCGTSSTTITCVSTEQPCTSNQNNQCLTVTVTYNYNASPLFPELPGMGVITPSTISSSNTLQISNPSS
jgi:Flp pilus assembly protein TadG